MFTFEVDEKVLAEIGRAMALIKGETLIIFERESRGGRCNRAGWWQLAVRVGCFRTCPFFPLFLSENQGVQPGRKN